MGRSATSINMLAFREGEVWETPSGKRLTVMDRAFICLGKRWVAVFDQDFNEPRLMDIGVLEEYRARPLHA